MEKDIKRSFHNELINAIGNMIADFNDKNKTDFEIIDDKYADSCFSIIDNDTEDDNIIATFGW